MSTHPYWPKATVRWLHGPKVTELDSHAAAYLDHALNWFTHFDCVYQDLLIQGSSHPSPFPVRVPQDTTFINWVEWARSIKAKVPNEMWLSLKKSIAPVYYYQEDFANSLVRLLFRWKYFGDHWIHEVVTVARDKFVCRVVLSAWSLIEQDKYHWDKDEMIVAFDSLGDVQSWSNEAFNVLVRRPPSSLQ